MRVLSLLSVGMAVALATSPALAQQIAQAAPAAAARAGVAAAVKGDVKLAAVPGVREVGKDVASGDAIFLGDQVTTGAEGRLQIMLLDETVFTIGPNAALVIDQFVFDPQSSAGKVTASVLKGTFRFVTGKVAKRQPSDMEVKLPVGSIGVRGTSVAGVVEGDRATVVLLGPGPETNTNERVGRILVTGAGAAGAATTVEIVRPGFGTEITGANIPPTPPTRIDPGRIAAITAPLAGTGPRPAPTTPQGQQQGQSQGPAQPGQPQPGQPQPGQPQGQPGQQGPGPTAGPINAGVNAGPIAPSGNLVRINAPPLANEANFLGPKPPPPIPPAISSFDNVRTITAGSGTFQSSNIPLQLVGLSTGAGGTYNYRIDFNYGARTMTTTVTSTTFTLGAQNSTINFNGPTLSYASSSGLVDMTTNLNNANSGIHASHTGVLRETLRNANGKIGNLLDVKLEIRDGGTCAGSNCVAGGRVAIPRSP